MSNITPLVELANFVGKSPHLSSNREERQKAIKSLKQNLMPETTRYRVSALIDIVMVRSAQARRKGQARVNIDLDVFKPDCSRAVTLTF